MEKRKGGRRNGRTAGNVEAMTKKEMGIWREVFFFFFVTKWETERVCKIRELYTPFYNLGVILPKPPQKKESMVPINR